MSKDDIDSDGFRSNVGIIVCNPDRFLLLASRRRNRGWQFPQGGVHYNETPQEAMYRELNEEIGLKANNVKILAETSDWLKYRLPEQHIRKDSKRYCIGQKQKWYLLDLISDESEISLEQANDPEFDHWKWVSYWYPVSKVIFFKRQVYNSVLLEFRSVLFEKEVPSRPKWWPKHWQEDCERIKET